MADRCVVRWCEYLAVCVLRLLSSGGGSHRGVRRRRGLAGRGGGCSSSGSQFGQVGRVGGFVRAVPENDGEDGGRQSCWAVLVGGVGRTRREGM